MHTVRFGDFEWDEAKAHSNERKHGVSFVEACEVFLDELAAHFADAVHPGRVIVIGHSQRARILFVVYLEPENDGTIRIVSARRATRPERKLYAKAHS